MAALPTRFAAAQLPCFSLELTQFSTSTIPGLFAGPSLPRPESKEICQGPWKAAQDAALLMIKSYKVYDDLIRLICLACSTFRNLLQEKVLVEFRATHKFKDSLFSVDATLSERSLGWYSFTHDEFGPCKARAADAPPSKVYHRYTSL
jgi:hypothetical protein